MPDFQGMRVTQGDYVPPRGIDVHRVRIVRHDDEMRLDRFGHIGWGGNSGFQALNLAVQFGARRVVLVGYDMHLDAGVHWHGRHGGKLSNPTSANARSWRKRLDDVAGTLAGIGVEVLNASKISALQNYRKVDFEEAINDTA